MQVVFEPGCIRTRKIDVLLVAADYDKKKKGNEVKMLALLTSIFSAVFV